jgi:hypothetical protein
MALPTFMAVLFFLGGLKPQNCYGGHSGRGGKSGEAAQKGRDLRLLASVALKLWV